MFHDEADQPLISVDGVVVIIKDARRHHVGLMMHSRISE
jgi:hypothetical protein